MLNSVAARCLWLCRCAFLLSACLAYIVEASSHSSSSSSTVFTKDIVTAVMRDDITSFRSQFFNNVMKEKDHGGADICTYKGVVKKKSKTSSSKYYIKNPSGSYNPYNCPEGQYFSISKCNCLPADSACDTDLDKGGFHRSIDVDKINAQNGTGCSLLHIAAWYGSVRVARLLLENGANIYIENDLREQPMHYAAFRNQLLVIEALFEKAGDGSHQHKLIFARQYRGQTPFFYSIKGRSLSAASKLLDLGASVDSPDLDKVEPIHYAVALDDKECVEFLIKHGASLSNPCCFSTIKTAYHIAAEYNSISIWSGRLAQLLETFARSRGHELMCVAARNGSCEFARILVRGYADAVHTDSCRYAGGERVGQPLHVAAYYGHLDFVEFLLKRADVDPNAADSRGVTPLMDAIERLAVGIVSVLLDHHARVDLTDATGRNPFLVAASKSSIVIAKLLTAKHANPFVADRKGFTALHLTSDIQFLEYLLSIKRSSDFVNLKTNRASGHLTPLHIAVIEKKSPEFIQLLIAHGADPFIQDDWQGYTAVHFAIEVGSPNKVLDSLLKRVTSAGLAKRDRFGRTAFHLAVAKGSITAARSILQLQLPLMSVNDAVEGSGETALHIAARQGSYEVVKFLLDNSADISIISEAEKRTPLLEALYWRHFSLFRSLLHDKLELLIRDVNGRNALHYACLHDQLDLVKKLIDYAKEVNKESELINSVDCHGETPLHYAVRLNNMDILLHLIDCGADCTLRSNEGRSPLHLAAHLGHLHTLKNMHFAGSCDLAQPDSHGHLALEYQKVKILPQFVEEMLREFGGQCCEGVAFRLALAIKIGARAFVKMILLENKNCNVKELFTTEHAYSTSALNSALMRRDIDMILVAYESGAFSDCVKGNNEITGNFQENRPQNVARNMMIQLIFGHKALSIAAKIEVMKRYLEEDGPCVEADSAFNSQDFLTNGEDDEMRIKYALKLLIDQTGLDVNFIDADGNGLLHYLAVVGCDLASTAVLLKCGADPNLVNKAGLTPLHICALSKSNCAGQFADLLMRKGARGDCASVITLPDGDSELTAVHLAAGRCGNIQVIEAFAGLGMRRRKKDLWEWGTEYDLTASYTVVKTGEDLIEQLEAPSTTTSTTTTTPTTTATSSITTTTEQQSGSAAKRTTTPSRASRLALLGNSLEIPILNGTDDRFGNSSNDSSSDLLLMEPIPIDSTKREILSKKTKLNKTVSLLAIEHNRFDVLHRLQLIGGEEFSIFKSPNKFPRPRISREINFKQPDAFMACRYLIGQCEEKISLLSDRSAVCGEKLRTFSQSEFSSLSMVRKSVEYSSQIVKLGDNETKKKFYFLLKEGKTRDDAESACFARGATLAQVKNLEEQLAVRTIDHPDMPKTLWVGLKRGEKQPNKFWWSSGVQLTKEHSVSGDEKCATMTLEDNNKMSFKSENCGEAEVDTLCEIDFPQPEFWVMQGLFTWQQAQDACVAEATNRGAHGKSGLAMPKYHFIHDAVLNAKGWPDKMSGLLGCWIGLRRVKNNDNMPDFKWNDGTHLEPLDLMPWSPGHPIGVGGPDDCVEMFSMKHLDSSLSNKTTDLPCELRLNCAVCYREV